ncbi:glycosyltransferase [Coprobacillus cateniformis]|uniref:glycosyltransferase n=1 Tax=Coprobacillus cateniformis TaxID=100884 RepID=UPI0024A8A1B0|nr:glycosyltransferase [Coprobacillus cateniformis]
MISVIMATYNGADFLLPQLESIRKQTVVPDEVVFLDDVSSDSTISIIENYIDMYQLKNWFVFRNTSNVGHYYNFIYGLKNVHGDLVFFADQDDIWDIHKIEIMSQIMESNPNITCLKSIYKTIDDSIIATESSDNYSKKIIYPRFVEQMTDSGLGCQMCFRKSIIDFVLKNEIIRYESFDYHDLLLSYISSAIGKNAIVEDYLLFHRYHENNATRKSTYKYCSDTRIKRINLIQVQSGRMIALLDIMDKYNIHNEELHKSVQAILKNNSIRIKFLQGHILMVFILFKNRKYYKEFKTFLGDVLCGLGINALICYFRK